MERRAFQIESEPSKLTQEETFLKSYKNLSKSNFKCINISQNKPKDFTFFNEVSEAQSEKNFNQNLTDATPNQNNQKMPSSTFNNKIIEVQIECEIIPCFASTQGTSPQNQSVHNCEPDVDKEAVSKSTDNSINKPEINGNQANLASEMNGDEANLLLASEAENRGQTHESENLCQIHQSPIQVCTPEAQNRGQTSAVQIQCQSNDVMEEILVDPALQNNNVSTAMDHQQSNVNGSTLRQTLPQLPSNLRLDQEIEANPSR